MKWYTKIKFDCRHTTYLIEKRNYGYLNIYELVKMYIHLITCPFCRLYKKQTRVVARILKRMFKGSEPARLDSTFKERLQRLIEERIDKKL